MEKIEQQIPQMPFELCLGLFLQVVPESVLALFTFLQGLFLLKEEAYMEVRLTGFQVGFRERTGAERHEIGVVEDLLDAIPQQRSRILLQSCRCLLQGLAVSLQGGPLLGWQCCEQRMFFFKRLLGCQSGVAQMLLADARQ